MLPYFLENKKRERFLVLTLLAAIILCLQWLGPAFTNESGAFPDEGSHFMSGIMVHDYLVDSMAASPMEFAENYYIHYPKVAIGQWPPLFYLVQALWMVIFTVSRNSIVFLLAVITTLIAFTIYIQLRKEFSIIISLVPAVMFLLTPIVQKYADIIMAEMLLTLLTLWSIIVLARFIETQKLKHAIAFGFLAGATIMTKGNGLALGIATLLTVFFCADFKILKNYKFWLIPAIVLVICLPFYIFSIQIVQNSWVEAGPHTGFFLSAIKTYPIKLLRLIGIIIFILFLVGFVSNIKKIKDKNLSPKWAAICSLPISVLLLLCIIPSSIEVRHLIQFLPAVFMLVCPGIVWVADGVTISMLSLNYKACVLSILVLICFVLTTFNLPQQADAFGFANIAELVLQNKTKSNSVVLISSDPEGEGMFISELAIREKRPGHIVLRASKVLGISDWIGRDYRAIYSSTAEVMNYLRSIPVGVVLIDDSILPGHDKFHHKLLKSTLNQYKQDWQLIRAFDVTKYSKEIKSAVKVYSMCGIENNKPKRIKINMKNKFGKDFTQKDAQGVSK